MGKLLSILSAVKGLLKTYPALSAALVNFGVFAAGYFGLHITAGQLVAAVGVLDVLFGVIVHSNVVPLVKANAAPTVVVNSPAASADVGNAVVSVLRAYSRGSGPVAADTVPVETVHEAIVPLEGK